MVLLVELILPVVSCYLAFILRFDGQIPARTFRMFVATIPWLLLARGLTFFVFRLDEGMWRYAGFWDLRRIVAAVPVSTVAFYLFVRYGYGTDDYPRSIFLIDSALLLILMASFRLSPRLLREFSRPRGRRRLLVFGAGDTGERALRQLSHDRASVYEPVGFIDDDGGKVGQRIHGVPVLGRLRDLKAIVKHAKPDEIVVAISRLAPGVVRELVAAAEPFDLPISVFERKANGNGGAAEIRSLSIDDLLARPPVGLDDRRVHDLVTGRRVLVTGAGGSIGSELSRQIAALRPASLVLFERYENGLHSVATSLQDHYEDSFVHAVVGDITDSPRLAAVFRQHRPEIVFHAAAHKHVPLREGSPSEAVKNNVVGTRLVAETAKRHGVDRFILISTDKAVNPTSVMGASKRIAEMQIRRMALRGATRFVTVRFGNVLGSNGSVVPRFQEQIRAGGPVTVTDPNVTRYFMLIPEAVQLVLHAAAVGEGGDTMILDMGEQIRVLDLARNLIRLSGHKPDEDIPIVFTGMRPGEKMYEELAGEGEIVERGPIDKIQRILSQAPHPIDVEADLAELERMAAHGDEDAVMMLLCRLIPSFRPTRSMQTV
jgi:FlaA1/EpsC-like NDP-sugar epimerase